MDQETMTAPRPVERRATTQHMVCPLCDPNRALCGHTRKSVYYLRSWADVPTSHVPCVVCRDLQAPHRPHIHLWRQLRGTS